MRKPILYASVLAVLGISACKSTYQNVGNTVAFPSFSAEAHRGGRGLMPENTIEAMKNTLALDRLTTLEMDTHITKDGQVVVTHDDYLSPGFMLTPDGKEIPKSDAKKYPIFGMDYNELKKFDLGTKPHAQFPRQKKFKTHIPLLADLIDAVQKDIKDNKRKQFFYNIETKCSAKGDGVVNPAPEVFVKLLMDVIEQKKITPYVVIQSFDMRTLRIIHKKYPQVRTSLLISNKNSYEDNIAELGFKPFIYSVEYKIVTADLVKKAHADGVKVIPWTVNTAEELAQIKSLNVDGVISDYPDLF